MRAASTAKDLTTSSSVLLLETLTLPTPIVVPVIFVFGGAAKLEAFDVADARTTVRYC